MIKQKHSQDCGVACLAMFLGVSYEKIQEKILINLDKYFIDQGMSIEDIAIVLNSGFGLDSVLIRTLLPKVPAIITVPSLGTQKMFHYIYFDGGKIYDPSNFDCYTTEDFQTGFPMSEAICTKADYKHSGFKLPSHLINEFDWEYLNDNY